MIFLVVLNGRPPGRDDPAPVSVWVRDVDPEAARRRALDVLETRGFAITEVESVIETTAEDYFRPCESRAAFERAEREGIAWRLPEADR